MKIVREMINSVSFVVFRKKYLVYEIYKLISHENRKFGVTTVLQQGSEMFYIKIYSP